MAGRQEDDLFITEIRTPSVVSLEDMNSGLRNAYQFLRNLPRVEMGDVPADARECTICQEIYGTDGHDTTVVQMPPCGHRFGMDCIFEWLTPTNFPNRNSCPVCRAVFFEIKTLDDDYPEPVYVGDSEAETERYDDDDDEFDDPSAFWEDWGSEDGEEYTPRHSHSQVLPELCVLLGQRTQNLYIAGTQEEYIAALEIIESIFQGEIQMPEGFTYSRQILALVREFPLGVFDQILVANAPSQIHIIAPRLVALMGRLVVRFGAQMERAGFLVPWGPQGPSTQNLQAFSMDNFSYMKDGVRVFVRFEEGRGVSPGLVNPGVTGMDFGTAPEPTARRRSY